MPITGIGMLTSVVIYRAQSILTTYQESISRSFSRGVPGINLIELGSGDGVKTKVLLQSLIRGNVRFNYMPVDISQKANDILTEGLKKELPSLSIDSKTGDYFQVMQQINRNSSTRKVILFLGSNIGNFAADELSLFLGQLSEFMKKSDQVLIGFDLKKSPGIIVKAYNDPHGHTRRFNLNHLDRINKVLGTNFNADYFEHFTEYSPVTGEVKSYLVSKRDQNVQIETLDKSFSFKKWDPIFMELSRKFDLATIWSLAKAFGFCLEQNYTDSRNYFVDSLWIKE